MTERNQNWFRRHKILTAVIVVFLLAIIGGIAGEDQDKTEQKVSNNEEVSEKVVDAQIGVPARDGKFEFVVSGIRCGKESVGTNTFLTKTAQGQYCLLDLTVKNIGDQAQSLFSSNQYLLNAGGQKYSADDVATSYNSPSESNTWYNDINPGNSVSGAIVFDIPKDQVPVTALLHDSALSGGVRVVLN